jgi:hypothetical protein
VSGHIFHQTGAVQIKNKSPEVLNFFQALQVSDMNLEIYRCFFRNLAPSIPAQILNPIFPLREM